MFHPIDAQWEKVLISVHILKEKKTCWFCRMGMDSENKNSCLFGSNVAIWIETDTKEQKVRTKNTTDWSNACKTPGLAPNEKDFCALPPESSIVGISSWLATLSSLITPRRYLCWVNAPPFPFLSFAQPRCVTSTKMHNLLSSVISRRCVVVKAS